MNVIETWEDLFIHGRGERCRKINLQMRVWQCVRHAGGMTRAWSGESFQVQASAQGLHRRWRHFLERVKGKARRLRVQVKPGG